MHRTASRGMQSAATVKVPLITRLTTTDDNWWRQNLGFTIGRLQTDVCQHKNYSDRSVSSVQICHILGRLCHIYTLMKFFEVLRRIHYIFHRITGSRLMIKCALFRSDYCSSTVFNFKDIRKYEKCCFFTICMHFLNLAIIYFTTMGSDNTDKNVLFVFDCRPNYCVR